MIVAETKHVMLWKTLFYLGIFVFLLIAGCSSDSDDNPIQGDGEIEQEGNASGFNLEVSPDAKTISLLKDGVTLLSIPEDGLRLGRIPITLSSGVAFEDVNFDPYWIDTSDLPPPYKEELVWLKPLTMEQAESSDAGSTYTVTYDGGVVFSLEIEEISSHSYKFLFKPVSGAEGVGFIRLQAKTDPQEGFYGLGNAHDHVNHRGKRRAMQLEAIDSESQYNERHVPIPLLIGSTGWGWFVNDFHPAEFKVATEADDLVETTFGTGMDTGDGLEFYFFAEDQPLDITKHYYEITGYPILPARWALGPWIWRDENDNQQQVIDDIDTIRELDLATSGYWIDRPYATEVGAFNWNPEQWTDAPAMIDYAHDMGLRMAIWQAPYVDADHETTQDNMVHVTENGFLPLKTGLPLNKWGTPLDLTNPDCYDWWQTNMRFYTDMGIEGFKMDYAEDVLPGLPNFRNVWEFYDGSNEQTMHARYQLFYHKVYAELLPEDGGFLICRGGTIGDQVNVSVIWPGDLDATFDLEGDLLDDDGKQEKAVGGFPSSMIYGLSLGPSGFPFYGADTGGYIHAPPDNELFMRWFEQTALSSVMQVGTNSNDVPWEFETESGERDETLLESYRKYARLHLRLWPYEWTYAQNIATDGRPIQRPFGLAFPETGEHPWDCYLFGEHLFVAPILERGAVARDVTFPPGEWIDWWTGNVYQGGQTKSVDAPLGTLPLYVARGGIVPMLRPTIDTMAPTTHPEEIDSYATTPGVLFVRAVPGIANVFEMFDGTKIELTSGGLLYEGGEEFAFGAVFELLAVEASPASVTLDGTSLTKAADASAVTDSDAEGWWYDAGAKTLWIRVSDGDKNIEWQ